MYPQRETSLYWNTQSTLATAARQSGHAGNGSLIPLRRSGCHPTTLGHIDREHP